jgi:hypothetical protein
MVLAAAIIVSFMISQDVAQEIVGSELLTPEEARTIVQLAYLTTELDFDEDADELQTLDQLARNVWALAGTEDGGVEVVSPLPIDAEERRGRIRELATQLSKRGARELAYVAAYLLAASDLELAPIEGSFLDELQDALEIEDERAADLVAMSAERVTPGVRDEDSAASVQGAH